MGKDKRISKLEKENNELAWELGEAKKLHEHSLGRAQAAEVKAEALRQEVLATTARASANFGELVMTRTELLAKSDAVREYEGVVEDVYSALARIGEPATTSEVA